MSETQSLTTSLQFIKGVGPKLAKALSKKGLSTIEDALYFVPRTYEDRRRLTPMNRIQPAQKVTVCGEVVSKRTVRRGRTRRMSFEVTLSDGTGQIQLFWFNSYPSLTEIFQKGRHFVCSGEVKVFGSKAQITHPDYEAAEMEDDRPVASLHFGRIVPVYSESEGLHQKTLRKIMGEVVKTSLTALEDPIPTQIRDRLELPSLRTSFVETHFPTELPEKDELTPALRRIIFEEFFVLQLGLALKKMQRKKEKGIEIHDPVSYGNKFEEALPFSMTDDQKLAIKDIATDMREPVPMSRLIQGDVGSGKTVVAMHAAARVAGSGYQTALMVPTEILAHQHLKNAKKWLEPLGIKCEILVHGASKDALERVASGEAKFVVGTHALFQQKIEFDQLALVVVDEQHRFGVEQRNELIRKGKTIIPHLLMMSATPIPRTLAFTMYGDLDFSIIRQKPAGRQAIETRIFRERQRPHLYDEIRKTIDAGQQAYIIYPLVEKSEKLELKSATEMYERIRKEVFADYSLALLHGRMKSEEKDEVLRDFAAGKYQILVSTTVIEVGIDVPNATTMVIEHPERLGLSQLHQLRGRVGRGSLKSRCILMSSFITERLKVMTETEDGFKIAEEDLRIRGPGEFMGTRQSGLPGFRLGHLLRDGTLLSVAREEALRILKEDPDLNDHPLIRDMVEHRWKEKLDRLRSG